jgi:hypothetical protein
MIEFIGPIYKLAQHFTDHYLRLDTLDFWPHYTIPLLQLNTSTNYCGQNQSQNYFTTGALPPISSPWRRASWDSPQLILYFNRTLATMWSRDSAVGIATDYGLDDWGVGNGVPVGSRIFSSANRPERLWGPPNHLSNGYRGSFAGGKAAGAWSWPLTSN